MEILGVLICLIVVICLQPQNSQAFITVPNWVGTNLIVQINEGPGRQAENIRKPFIVALHSQMYKSRVYSCENSFHIST